LKRKERKKERKIKICYSYCETGNEERKREKLKNASWVHGELIEEPS
jgi:hypothetical protein